MHNLGTVFQFEVLRSLKKKSFWITALSFPVIIAVVFAVIFFSNKSSDQVAENAKNEKFTIAITDTSNVIPESLSGQYKAERVSEGQKQATIDKVSSGKLDAYFYYPKDLSKEKVEVYGKDVGLFNNGKYEAVAKLLLQQSVASNVDPQTTAILQDTVGFNAATYKDGRQFDGIKELIAPGIFLVMFYFLIAMFGNQMLTSTTEEKENRVIEMVLTTIQARVLIIGKIISLLVLAAIQALIVLVPVLIIYLLFREQLQLPSFDLTSIPLDVTRIAIGAVLFVLSFLLFTGLLVGIGAASPTAKEAGGFFGIAMIFIFGPLYAVTLFFSQPDSPIVRFLTFFPLTAPIPLMLRNAIGNLSTLDVILGIAILAVSAVIALSVAIRMFRYGALEYSKRLSLSTIFAKKS
ncbi:ABC transporter permease [bacterium]|nr:MAG: ABC transporter permease [bacterium]